MQIKFTNNSEFKLTIKSIEPQFTCMDNCIIEECLRSDCKSYTGAELKD